jgi:hypothetical protein
MADAGTAQRNKRYSLDDDLMPIIEGTVVMPNVEEKSFEHVINSIAARGHSLLPKWGYARMSPGIYKSLAQYFLTPSGMGSACNGSFDGGGYALVYRSGTPLVVTFAICRHEKEDAPDADHRRGWHPGHCKKCGLDMTVDSGD